MFCSTSIANGVAFLVGASRVGSASGVGRIYTWSVEGATGSGLLVAWQWQWGSVSWELVEG